MNLDRQCRHRLATQIEDMPARTAGRYIESLLPDPEIDLTRAIEAGPDLAAAAAWNAPTPSVERVITELVTRAALHHDAHYVKYTLACLDAAAIDRRHQRLYLAAAAKLAGYWATIT